MQAATAPQRRRTAPAGTMRAAVLTQPRRFEIYEITIPEPRPNELLVRVQGCGICASNIPPFEGRPWFIYPMEPGAL
ncbi:MAG: L-iditol 2-dehydrogenase, partial [Verrucomicrobia bacterium]|nr:L-iditol 2-dehydrogenase [Verrucomicrobiota bacterium]